MSQLSPLAGTPIDDSMFQNNPMEIRRRFFPRGGTPELAPAMQAALEQNQANPQTAGSPPPGLLPGASPNQAAGSHSGQPFVSNPTANPRVAQTEQTPLEALGSQNAFIQQLVGKEPQAPQINHAFGPSSTRMSHGGALFDTPGAIGVDPAAALQTSIYNTQQQGRGQDVSELMRRLGTMGDQSIRQGDLNLRQVQALGVPAQGGRPAIPGSIETNAQLSNDRNRTGPAFIQNTITAIRAANPAMSEDEVHKRAAANLGLSVNEMIRQVGVNPTAPPLPAGQTSTGSVSTAPAGVPTVQTAPNPRDVVQSNSPSADTPWAGIADILNRHVNGPVPPGQTQAPRRDIGEFLGALDASHPGMIEQNIDKIIPFIRSTWGDQAADSALRSAQTPRQTDPNAPSSTVRALTHLRQFITGPNANEQGLSALGDLIRRRGIRAP